MPLTSSSIKPVGLKTLQGKTSYFTLQYFANFSYNDLLTRLFTVFLLKKKAPINSKFSENCLKSCSEEKRWMERKGSGLLGYDEVFWRPCSYWVAFISLQLLSAEGCAALLTQVHMNAPIQACSSGCDFPIKFLPKQKIFS